MANLQPHFDFERPNTVAALGLRWSALRGMLGSPLIEADEHHSLREELVQELQSVGQSMAEIASRNAIELCAKIDLLGEEIKASGNENDPKEALLASIRKDVASLLPRALVEQRSSAQIVRGAAPTRTPEPVPTEGSRAAQA